MCFTLVSQMSVSSMLVFGMKDACPEAVKFWQSQYLALYIIKIKAFKLLEEALKIITV